MSKVKNFRNVIDLWPTAADFGRDIGVTDINARAMRQRNSIPSEYWCKVVERASAIGHKVTYESLAKFAEARNSQAAGAR